MDIQLRITQCDVAIALLEEYKRILVFTEKRENKRGID